MLPIVVFSGLLAVMLLVVWVHQRRMSRPQGRHVAGPAVREVRRALGKHAA